MKCYIFVFALYISITCRTVSEQIQNPYYVLGLHRSASSSEIKREYKKLAKEWHPDKNKHPEASEKFMTIAQAYEVC